MGEMGEDGEKWGDMGETGERGGNWGERGGMGWNREIVGRAHRMCVVEGCGGMRFRKMGQKWQGNRRKMGRKYPFFTVPCFLILPEVKDLPNNSLCKNQLTALTDGKIGTFVTHSPPRRPVRMLEHVKKLPKTCQRHFQCTDIIN